MHTNQRVARRRNLQLLAGLATSAVFPSLSFAQASVAKLMVPFPPGGPADAMARVLVDKLKDELGQPVIVENRPGASTRLAAEVLKQTKPDGATVLMTLLDTMVMAPLVYGSLRYDPEKDFVSIAEVSAVHFCIAVNAKAPYKTLAEYLEAAKADPQVASLGVASGLGTVPHFLAFDLERQVSAGLNIIPYQGGAAVVTSLLGNQLGSAIDGLGVFIDQHKAGKLRVLAVSNETRASQLPDVPTFGELGFKSLVVRSAYALYAPQGTNAAQVARWNTAINNVLLNPAVKSRIQEIGYEPASGTGPQDVAKLKDRLSAHWSPIVKASGYKAE